MCTCLDYFSGYGNVREEIGRWRPVHGGKRKPFLFVRLLMMWGGGAACVFWLLPLVYICAPPRPDRSTRCCWIVWHSLLMQPKHQEAGTARRFCGEKSAPMPGHLDEQIVEANRGICGSVSRCWCLDISSNRSWKQAWQLWFGDSVARGACWCLDISSNGWWKLKKPTVAFLSSPSAHVSIIISGGHHDML